MKEKQNKEFLTIPMVKQGFSHAPSCVIVTWESKYHHSKCPLSLSSFPPDLYAEADPIWSGIFLWSVGISCLGCVLFQLAVRLQPLRQHGSTRSKKGLDAVQALLRIN